MNFESGDLKIFCQLLLISKEIVLSPVTSQCHLFWFNAAHDVALTTLQDIPTVSSLSEVFFIAFRVYFQGFKLYQFEDSVLFQISRSINYTYYIGTCRNESLYENKHKCSMMSQFGRALKFTTCEYRKIQNNFVSIFEFEQGLLQCKCKSYRL